ncbi:MAG TPA: hypothetical protein VIK18_16950 [Pirellulales bacterium]
MQHAQDRCEIVAGIGIVRPQSQRGFKLQAGFGQTMAQPQHHAEVMSGLRKSRIYRHGPLEQR